MRYIPSWNLICWHKTYPISIDNSDPTVSHHTPVGIATRPAHSFGALTRMVLSSLLNLHLCSLSTAHSLNSHHTCTQPPTHAHHRYGTHVTEHVSGIAQPSTPQSCQPQSAPTPPSTPPLPAPPAPSASSDVGPMRWVIEPFYRGQKK